MYLGSLLCYSIIYLASNFYLKHVGACVWVGGWVFVQDEML